MFPSAGTSRITLCRTHEQRLTHSTQNFVAAGKIASHGPYKKVKDIYKIPGLNEHDLAMFKKYEKEFTVKIPGRTFDERINARVST